MIGAGFEGHLGAILGYFGALGVVLGLPWAAFGLDLGASQG